MSSPSGVDPAHGRHTRSGHARLGASSRPTSAQGEVAPVSSLRSMGFLGLVVCSALLAGCVSGSSPARSGASTPNGPSAAPSVSPSRTLEPSPSLPADLGPAPTIQYPEVQTLAVATLRLTRPMEAIASFWVACEWASTEEVGYLYPEAATLLGERIHPSLVTDTDGNGSFFFDRDGAVAPYYPDQATVQTAKIERGDGAITFTGL